MDIEISKMNKDELEEVASVFLKVFNSTGEEWTRESAGQHVRENYLGKYHFVVRHKEKLIGFLMAIPLTRERGKELFVDSIAVLPDYQKKGVGIKLWEEAVASAKENNLVGVRFLSNPSLPSYKWYKDMGYEESGWIEIHKPLT